MSFGTALCILLTTASQQVPPPKAPPPRVQDSTVPPAVSGPPPTEPSARLVSAPLSAAEAARIALSLQPNVKAAVGEIATARGRVRQAQANLNPQLVANAGYDSISSVSGQAYGVSQAPLGSTVIGSSPVYQYSAALQLRQLIFDFDQTRNIVRQNQALASAAETNLTQVQQDLVQSVKNAFYAFASDVELVKVNEQDVANRQRQLDLADARLRHEIGLPSDVVVAETSKSQAILALNLARDQAEQARVNLLNLMGVDPNTPVVAADAVEPPVAAADPVALLKEALRLRPEIQFATRNLSATKYGLGAAKALGLPSVYAEAALGASGNEFPLKDNASSLGIGFQFSIFDGGLRAGAVETAKGQVDTALANLQSAVISVRSDVTSAYLQLESAEQRVLLANQEVANAAEGVRIAEGRYTSGLGLFQDITTAEGLLVNARTDQANVTGQLNEARTHLRHAVGEGVGR